MIILLEGGETVFTLLLNDVLLCGGGVPVNVNVNHTMVTFTLKVKIFPILIVQLDICVHR